MGRGPGQSLGPPAHLVEEIVVFCVAERIGFAVPAIAGNAPRPGFR